MLAPQGTFHVPRQAQTIGFFAGGAIGGGIGGALAPYFRKRHTAGLCIGLAATVGLAVANYFWHEWQEPRGSVGLGIIAGVVYAFAFWDYRGATQD